MSDKPSKLKIADREFTSRLLVGTGKFASNELMRDALMASGTEIVTVALRRIDLERHEENILEYIPPHVTLMTNTSGARNAKEAVFAAQLSREALETNWLKLENRENKKTNWCILYSRFSFGVYDSICSTSFSGQRVFISF